MTRRQFLWSSSGVLVPAVLVTGGAARLLAQGDWLLRPVRINDNAEIRLDGPRGQVVAGCNQQFTFCGSSPPVIALRRVDARITLYGRATSANGYGSCVIDVYFGNTGIQRWAFEREDLRTFQR